MKYFSGLTLIYGEEEGVGISEYLQSRNTVLAIYLCVHVYKDKLLSLLYR